MESLDKAEYKVLIQMLRELSPEVQQQVFKEATKPTHSKAYTTANTSENYIRKIKYQGGRITICPYCVHSHVIKRGFVKSNGYQRFYCKDCRKTFTYTNNTILFSSNKGLDVWEKYLHCIITYTPIRATAKICRINTRTAFLWRHKILDSLQSMQDQITLNGVIEADETFFHLSFKGNKKNMFAYGRTESAKRGQRAKKRGLSKEQVCVTCGVDRGYQSYAKVCNMGRPLLKGVEKVFDGRFEPNSIFVTDGYRGYNKLSAKADLEHFVIPRKKHSVDIYNIQLVNNYHSRVKKLVNGHFCGVATKYLNNYLVWFNMVSFSYGSDSHKEATFKEFVITNYTSILTSRVQQRNPMPMMA